MPGMSFVCGNATALGARKSVLRQALQDTVRFEHHESVVLQTSPNYMLACTKYPTYPLLFFETTTLYVCLEGCLRGVMSSQIQPALVNLSHLVFEDTPQAHARITSWLLETDGEFNILFLDKLTKNVAILVDTLSHLPLYYGSTSELFLVSRDPGFLIPFVTCGFDRRGLAEYLLFSYPLDSRTPFCGVHRVPGATLIRGQHDSSSFDISRCHTLNFEHRDYSGLSLTQNARNLADIMISSSRAAASLVSPSPNVLAFSGGLDSRVVAAAMQAAGVPFHAATRSDHRPRTREDVRVAKCLAGVLELDWRLFEIPQPTFEDALLLLRLRSGLNYLGMSFILSFLRQLLSHYGPDMTYWTGDTGLVLRRELPTVTFRDYNELLDYILQKHAIIGENQVAAILGMPLMDLRDQLVAVLESYPEASLGQKYVHFVIYGRAVKWHYEGMERNRAFFWLTAPLEFTSVVSYAMKCPDEQKSSHRLYRALLQLLSPTASGIEYAHFGVAPSSHLFPVVMKMRAYSERIPMPVKRLLKKLTGHRVASVGASDNIRRCIREQVRLCPSIPDYVVVGEIERFVRHCTPLQANVLLTVTSLLELVDGPDSSLMRLGQVNFDG